MNLVNVQLQTTSDISVVTAELAELSLVDECLALATATVPIGIQSTTYNSADLIKDSELRKSINLPMQLLYTNLFESLRPELENLAQKHLATKCELFAAEYQALYYPIGGHCFGHLDGEQETPTGEIVTPVRGRAATSLVYLAECEEGQLYFGANKELLIQPKKGLLVFWFNTKHHFHGTLTNNSERYALSCFWSKI